MRRSIYAYHRMAHFVAGEAEKTVRIARAKHTMFCSERGGRSPLTGLVLGTKIKSLTTTYTTEHDGTRHLYLP